MPESGPFGSVRGVPGNGHPYRDRRGVVGRSKYPPAEPKPMRHAQRLLSLHGAVSKDFRPGRHPLRARHYGDIMRRRFADWTTITGTESERRTATN